MQRLKASNLGPFFQSEKGMEMIVTKAPLQPLQIHSLFNYDYEHQKKVMAIEYLV
jgi:hypothetical protein